MSGPLPLRLLALVYPLLLLVRLFPSCLLSSSLLNLPSSAVLPTAADVSLSPNPPFAAPAYCFTTTSMNP